MSNQTSQYQQDIIFHIMSMTWIFVLLTACIALLCIQIDGAITFNFKWNIFDKLTRHSNNNNTRVHHIQRHVDNEQRHPKTTSNEKTLEENFAASDIQRMQDVERQLLEVNEVKRSLLSQYQSHQRLCQQLVQGQDSLDNETDFQHNEARDATLVGIHQLVRTIEIDPRELALPRNEPSQAQDYVQAEDGLETSCTITPDSAESTSGEESNRVAATANIISQLKVIPQTLPLHERESSSSSSKLDCAFITDSHINPSDDAMCVQETLPLNNTYCIEQSQSPCSHSQFGHFLKKFQLHESENALNSDFASITDTCSDTHVDTISTPPVHHSNDMHELQHSNLPCVVPSIRDTSDTDIQNVEQENSPTAVAILTKTQDSILQLGIVESVNQVHSDERNLACGNVDKTQTEAATQFTNTAGKLAEQTEDELKDELLPETFSSIVTIETLFEQIETCMRAFDKPTDWKTQIRALRRLELALQIVASDAPLDGVLERMLPLAAHVDTLLSSIHSRVVKLTCSILTSFAALFGPLMAPFNDQVVVEVLNTARINIQVFREAGEECMQVMSTHSRYNLDIMLDYFDSVKEDEIQNLILKQLPLIMASWSKLELEPYNERLKAMLRKVLGERIFVRIGNRDKFIDIPSFRHRGAFHDEHPTARITFALASKFGGTGERPKRIPLQSICIPTLANNQSMPHVVVNANKSKSKFAL
ncbi:hypothetical protein AC1031_001550 [Aphanomyces cochlioides]|nr:hypothetical protein AC1031_001550 [Aphanomyces cochlioides]